MIFNNQFISILIPPWVLITSGFVLSLVITVYGIPSVVRIARIKGFFDNPGTRTSHEAPTPRLGGSIIFSGTILSSVLFTGLSSAHELKYIIAGMIILFFIGIKDDLVSLVHYKKALGQLFAAAVIVFPGDIHLTFLNGLLGNNYVEIIFNMLLSLFIVMALINSINFIDGIDGLASGVGIIASLLFGIWFLMIGQTSYSVICFALAGSLIAFFYYNVFSRKYKTFLGDTGSMLIGFLLAVFVIHFIEINSSLQAGNYNIAYAPAMALSILFVPFFDTIRICLIRILNGKSVFEGDNNHIHHRVLKYSGTHLKATMIILTVNILIIFLTYLFGKMGNIKLATILVFLGIIFSIMLGTSINHADSRN